MVTPILLASGALVSLVSLILLKPRLPKRKNFAGRNIPTSAGTTLLPIILMMGAGVVVFGDGGGAFLAYSLLGGLVGLADDVWGGAGVRGFRGHVGALGRGRLTTGMIKVVALVGGALAVGVWMFGVGATALFAAFLLAGSTNVANLLDVRPGRAIKFVGVAVVALLFVAPGEAVLVVLPVVGGAAALFKFDLGGRIMLGDAGAAVLGVVLGYLVVACGPGLVWAFAGAAILALTAVAEFSSISGMIEGVGALRWLDLWGRDE